MMKLPWRRPKPPGAVRDAVTLGSDEKVLSAAEAIPDGFVVATNHALTLLMPQTESPSSPATDAQSVPDAQYEVQWRITWDQVDKAKWEPPQLLLQIRPTDGAGISQVFVDLDVTTDLPGVVRDCVNTSIVASDEIEVNGHSARVVGRRNPESSQVAWRVILGQGLNPNDEETMRAAEDGLASYRDRLGV